MTDDNACAVAEDVTGELPASVRLKLEHLEQIKASQARIDELRVAYEAAKEKAKGAKTVWEGAVETHGKLVRRNEQQTLLPFDQDTNQDWRKMSIADLGLPAGVATALEEAEVTTLGKLSDVMGDAMWYREIKRVGKGAAEKVADAFQRFWAEHPESCDFSPDTAEETK